MAARMMDSAEKAGKTITAGNASYYAADAEVGFETGPRVIDTPAP